MLQRWLANPWALWLFTALPVLAGFAMLAWLKRRRAFLLLGNLPSLYRVAGKGTRIVRAVFLTTALVMLVMGITGPQWGTQPPGPADLATGRDLVVVLDLSRSMLAEQPSRQERALKALKDLAATFEVQGGHRVALVVFAAHARLVFPLTTDYDHFRDALAQQDADNLPLSLRPRKDGAVQSGTRIGEALRTAVAAHDPKAKGAQDILLVSDGDDPAGDDEWAVGAEAARSQGIPVYTLGVGDSETASPIPTASGPLKHAGRLVTTRLEERPLEEIARRTQGLYFAARTHTVPLGSWLRAAMERRSARRPGDAADEQILPLYQQRAPWFFGAALGCFALSLLSDGWGFARKSAPQALVPNRVPEQS